MVEVNPNLITKLNRQRQSKTFRFKKYRLIDRLLADKYFYNIYKTIKNKKNIYFFLIQSG